jgi:homoserine kinase
MLSKDEATAKNVETVMIEVYKKIGIDFHTYVTTINKKGISLVK